MTRKNIQIIPDEIIKEELLIRLPVKTLIRFKSVSKDWKHFISHDYFLTRFQSRQHTIGSTTPTGFFCSTNLHASSHGYCAANKFLYTWGNHVQKEQLESFCIKSLNTFGFVIAASKGLLLLGYHPQKLYVYDVVSNKHVLLPRPSLPTWEGISLGFKCEEDRSTNHRLCFTVVFIDNTEIACKDGDWGSRYYAQTYSSETGTWRKSIIKSSLPFEIQYGSVGKVIGGVLHWAQHYLDWIVSYDGDRNVLIQIVPPSGKDSTLNGGTIMRQFEGRNDGSLQFVSIKDVVLSVWILPPGEGKGIVFKHSWSLVSRVSLSDIIGFGFIEHKKRWRIICADPIDPHVIYLNMDNHLYAYDYREVKIVSALSHQTISKMDVFVHFQWPTWPCL